jgi:hypothetical protein
MRSKGPTAIQIYLLWRMSEGWTLLLSYGRTRSILLRDSRDVTRRNVTAGTYEQLLANGWIRRTYLIGGGMRYKITKEGREALPAAQRRNPLAAPTAKRRKGQGGAA